VNGRDPTFLGEDHLLAQGFSAHLRRWAQRAGRRAADVDVLCGAAEALIQALMRGEVCINIDPSQLAALRASGCVTVEDSAHETGPTPLVLDRNNRLYLARYHAFETRLACDVQGLVAEAPSPPGGQARDWLKKLYPDAPTLPDRQALATAFAWSSIWVVTPSDAFAASI